MDNKIKLNQFKIIFNNIKHNANQLKIKIMLSWIN